MPVQIVLVPYVSVGLKPSPATCVSPAIVWTLSSSLPLRPSSVVRPLWVLRIVKTSSPWPRMMLRSSSNPPYSMWPPISSPSMRVELSVPVLLFVSPLSSTLRVSIWPPPWIVSTAPMPSTIPLTAMNCGELLGTPAGVTVFQSPAVLPTSTTSLPVPASIVVSPEIVRTAMRSFPPVVLTIVFVVWVL